MIHNISKHIKRIGDLLKNLYHYIIATSDKLFDPRDYLEMYPDVRKADINPLWHFVCSGWKEGRIPSKDFDNEEIKDVFKQKNTFRNYSFRQIYNLYKYLNGNNNVKSNNITLDPLFSSEFTENSLQINSRKYYNLNFSVVNTTSSKNKSKEDLFNLCDKDNFVIKKFVDTKSPYDIIGITRIRNEETIIEDTFNHISNFVDKIIVLDDDSLDRTLDISILNTNVITVIKNKMWINNRVTEETRHRQILLNFAKLFQPKWIFYFDADERFEGLSKGELLNYYKYSTIDGIKIYLFDAYLTINDKDPIRKGEKLLNRRKFFGKECREILMLWRNLPRIHFSGPDSREPTGCENTITKYFCQHYGKAISISEWENTCMYYSNHFPEPYKSKWDSRKGKAIHYKSDFGTDLVSWEKAKKNKIVIN